jgi:hypothetical protein
LNYASMRASDIADIASRFETRETTTTRAAIEIPNRNPHMADREIETQRRTTFAARFPRTDRPTRR